MVAIAACPAVSLHHLFVDTGRPPDLTVVCSEMGLQMEMDFHSCPAGHFTHRIQCSSVVVSPELH